MQPVLFPIGCSFPGAALSLVEPAAFSDALAVKCCNKAMFNSHLGRVYISALLNLACERAFCLNTWIHVWYGRFTTFSEHYHRSIDVNTANANCPTGMYFLIIRKYNKVHLVWDFLREGLLYQTGCFFTPWSWPWWWLWSWMRPTPWT